MESLQRLVERMALFGLVAACAPHVTVAEDDTGGGAGASVTGVGGTATNAGSGGSSGAEQGQGGSGSGSNASACPCSRRSEAPPSMDCPRGADRATAASVGPEGATVTLSGTRQTRGAPFELEIFAGSLEDEIAIEVRESSIAPPAGFVDWSPLYAIEPAGLDFAQGAVVSIPSYNSLTEIPPSIAIHYGENADGPFEQLADSVDQAGFSLATVSRTGFFFVGYPAASDSVCP